MGYSAKTVANYFLEKYREDGITPLKLQKLVYIAHGWHCAIHEDALISDEYAEAWQYGPVFASLYREFKHCGRQPIMGLAHEEGLGDNEELIEVVPRIPKGDKKTPKFLDEIWEIYGGYNALKLSSMCHEKGSPWHVVREKDKKRNVNIDNERIKKYYARKLKRDPSQFQNLIDK